MDLEIKFLKKKSTLKLPLSLQLPLQPDRLKEEDTHWDKVSMVERQRELWLDELVLTDLPMVTGGTTGSVEEGLALTGMGVVGPLTITWPTDKLELKKKKTQCKKKKIHVMFII